MTESASGPGKEEVEGSEDDGGEGDEGEGVDSVLGEAGVEAYDEGGGAIVDA